MPEYRHAIERNDHGVPPAKLFRGALVFGVALLASCLTISLLVTDPYWRPALADIDAKIEELVGLRDRVNVVFVGPSHIERGVDCDVFDRALASAGTDAFSYNFSMAGSLFVENRFLLAQLEHIAFRDLQYVIYEPRLNSVPDVKNLFATRVRYFASPGNVRDQARVRWSSLRSRWVTLGSVGVIYASYVVHVTNLGVISDMLPRPPAGSDSAAAAPPTYRGYLPFRADHRRGYLAQDAGAVDPLQAYRTLSDTEIGVVLDDLARIERLGATPVVLLPPGRNGPGFAQAMLEALRSASPDTLILDYHLTDPPHPIYDSAEYWFDHDHLNARGAAYFSRTLASDWVETVRAEQAVE